MLHDKVGALVGRFTRAKAPGGALLGAMGPVKASGKVQRGDEICAIGRVDTGCRCRRGAQGQVGWQPTVESRLERP